MNAMPPIRYAVALSLTVGLGYTACTVLFWIWPQAAANFMTALFHGLDFHKLQSGSTLFTFGGFAYALVVLMAWAFALGALYGWIGNRLGPRAQGG